jgi:hypothetical protein
MNSDDAIIHRNLSIRVLAFIFWLILFVILGNTLVGQTVIQLSNEDLNTYQGLVNANLESMKFMGNYSGYTTLAFAAVVGILSFLKILPCVSKIKKPKKNA